MAKKPIINFSKLNISINDDKAFKNLEKLTKGLSKFILMTEKFQGSAYTFKPDFFKNESFNFSDIEISESFKIKIFFIIDGFPKVWINGKNMYVPSINKGLVLKTLNKKTGEWKEKNSNITTARRLEEEVLTFLKNTAEPRAEIKEQKEIVEAYKKAEKAYKKSELEARKAEKEEILRQNKMKKLSRSALKSAETIPLNFF